MKLEAILIAIFLVTAGLAWVPQVQKIVSFLDTIVHEVGHGIITSPFGAALPSIRIRPDSSGETKSEMGKLLQLLPRPIAFIVTKIARVLNLLSGYSASIIVAALFMSLTLTPIVTISPWITMAFASMILATLLWTTSEIQERPILLAGAIAFIIWLAYRAGAGWISLALGASVLILLFLASNVLASIAFLTTLLGIIFMVIGLLQIPFSPLEAYMKIPLEFSPKSVVMAILLLIIFYALASSRTPFSLLVVSLGGVLTILAIIQPWWDWRYSVAAISGVLFSAGVNSFVELYQLTFRQTPYSSDVTFAAEELGLTPRIWYSVLVFITALTTIVILVK